MSEHARLSPSKAHCWMHCAASPVLSPSGDDGGSPDAREGTAAHSLASMASDKNLPAAHFIGQVIKVESDEFTVDEEMAAHVQTYLDHCKVLEGDDGASFTEVRVPIENWTKEAGAAGTSDKVIIRGDELIIVDLKFGRGVRVFAKENDQLRIYALGTLALFADTLEGIKRIRVVIDQPRLGHLDEWDCSLEELLIFGKEVETAALTVESATQTVDQWKDDPTSAYYSPGTETCRWCPLKATCVALSKFVETEVGAGFEDLSKLSVKELLPAGDQDLSRKMFALELIQDWCSAVRTHVEGLMLNGATIPGWKVVEGKKGNRKWGDEEAAKAKLKALRLRDDEMYEKTLISPTTAEKIFKKPKPKVWRKLQELITQSSGRLGIAPSTDERPAVAVTPAIEDFPDHTAEDLAA